MIVSSGVNVRMQLDFQRDSNIKRNGKKLLKHLNLRQE